MTLVGKAASSALVALALGAGSAALAIKQGFDRGWLKNGPWRTNPAVGSPQAWPHLKAEVALSGLFALRRSESIYYVAASDEEGRPLRSNCDYCIEGADFDARWWSITVYGRDYFLIANEWDRYSYNGVNVARNAAGGYTIHLSATPKAGNWLPAGNQRQLYLVLRLYNPGRSIQDNLEGVALPRILREGCR